MVLPTGGDGGFFSLGLQRYHDTGFDMTHQELVDHFHGTMVGSIFFANTPVEVVYDGKVDNLPVRPYRYDVGGTSYQPNPKGGLQ